MKKKKAGLFMIMAAACAAGLAVAAPGVAQLLLPGDEAVTDSPVVADPQHVAMIYYKFSRQVPDFSAWAQLSDAYKTAFDFDKLAAQSRQAEELQQAFTLITADEQIIARIPAALSGYSLDSEGYVVEGFTPGMFIPFSYAGENFAVVPQDVMEHQWLPVAGLAAKGIDDLRQQSESGRDVMMTFTLRPRFADKDKVNLDGQDYRLLGAEIVNLAIFDDKGGRVWEKGLKAEIIKEDPELMKLFR